MTHLRGEIRGRELTKTEHDMLYQRALTGSRKEAAAATGEAHGHHTMSRILAKLGVEDVTSAYAAMGWLRPLPYGVSAADRRHEDLLWGTRGMAVGYHVTGFGKSVDPEKAQAAFREFVRALDAATPDSGSDFEGLIAGGDWIGDSQAQANAFTLSAAAVRAEKQP